MWDCRLHYMKLMAFEHDMCVIIILYTYLGKCKIWMIYTWKQSGFAKSSHVNCAMNHPCPASPRTSPPCCLGFFEILEDPIGGCKLLEQFTLAKRIYNFLLGAEKNNQHQATSNNNQQKTTKLGESESCQCFTWNFIIPKILATFFSHNQKPYKQKVAPKPCGRNFSRPNPTWWNKPQRVGQTRHLWNPRFGPLNREEIERCWWYGFVGCSNTSPVN